MYKVFFTSPPSTAAAAVVIVSSGDAADDDDAIGGLIKDRDRDRRSPCEDGDCGDHERCRRCDVDWYRERDLRDGGEGLPEPPPTPEVSIVNVSLSICVNPVHKST